MASQPSDPLLAWRSEFPILETCTYLVSHSLAAMPKSSRDELKAFSDAWDTRGVRAWGEGWWQIGRETGNLLAPILGVAENTITMHQNASVAQLVAASCIDFSGTRNKIVLQDLDFPTNHYLFEGFRRQGAETTYVPSDNKIKAPIDKLIDAIDERTALVPISYVLFRSACVQDVKPVIEKAHRVGARVILDIYQAAGTVPLDIAGLGADFAVGGSVKWLCGGPGAGYLYVRPDLIGTLEPAHIGWAAHASPFAFETGAIKYAAGIERFQSGTPNVPSIYSARAGYKIVGKIGVQAIREKSLRLTRLLMDAAEKNGWTLNTPTNDDERGGSVVMSMPNSASIAEGLIQRNVIIDHRPDAGIRIAPHFYSTQAEVENAVSVIEALTS